MTTQPELTPEQMAQLLEQMTAAGGIDQLKAFAEMATAAVKDTVKASKAADDAEKLRLHAEASNGLRLSASTYLDQAYPDDKTPTCKNQAGSMTIRWFRDVDGRRVSVEMPKLKTQSASGERLKGTKFVPLHAKLCLGDSSQTENMEEYLGWFGITNVGASAHDKLKKLVEALNTPGSHVKVGTATVDNLIIKHGDINGGNPTRLCDHYHIAYDSK
jgi:hypothetical protein